ncbi:MFS transporter [Salinarimonas ramus]|uniref:MFS transporter n=1 Tax=Salinarimonas ramus TaxID=690164 RepID=A0A917V2D3_9HYPH|nr:MFS transporter [Salinarimonas ramus]GGK22161.1 MFS transporter [Salinarimonas ramus]
MRSYSLVWAAASGLALVGVSFGIARYGYGLFLPRIAETFSLDEPTQGLIASGSYASYVLATVAAAWASGRFGPRLPIALGVAAAAGGAAIVALAEGLAVLALGVALAGASPGLVFPALSDWVSIVAREEARNRLFAIMNSGTGAGVLLAAPFALVPAELWQHAWGAFALASVLFGAGAIALAPPFPPGRGNAEAPRFALVDLVRPAAMPLYASAFVAGLTTAVYWTFSIATIFEAGGTLGGFARPEIAFWALTGISGFVGALTGDAVNRRGLPFVTRGTLAAIAGACLLIGIAPGSGGAIVVSGAVFGAAFIFVTGLLGVWSLRVFPERPSAGFGATFLIFTFGAMIGPLAGGALSPALGREGVFVLVAVLTLVPCLLPRRTFAGVAAPAGRPA